MIKINRPDPPKFLIDPLGKWMTETDNAIQHYEVLNNTNAFDFQMFNDILLKDELRGIFSKCAYCESNFMAVFDGDVEHFRPKGRVKENDPQTPGYYWLANNWDNLFLACQHCNQRRKHILYGDDKLEGYGKLDQFPLLGEPVKGLSRSNHNLEKEEEIRLLINPCIDNPEEHFDYEKEEGVIVPKTKMAITSVKVYALQRPYLVQERKKRLLELFEQITRVKLELEVLNSDSENARSVAKFEFELNSLKNFTKNNRPYAGMCRYFVNEFLEENELV